MGAHRLVLLVVLSTVTLYVAPQAAAVKCGDSDSSTNGTARALLTLDAQSVTTQHYGRSTKPRTLNLIFKAAGCDLGTSQPDPDVKVLPTQNAEEVPSDVVSLKETTSDGSELSLLLSLNTGKLTPGSYGGLVRVRAPYLVTSRTPITLSRSEERMWIPFSIGALAGLLGFGWFIWLKFLARTKLDIKWWWLFPVGAVAAFFGGWSVFSSYWDQEVWTVNSNLFAAIAAGIAGATTGTMAALLAVVWQSDPKNGPPSSGPGPAPGPGPTLEPG